MADAVEALAVNAAAMPAKVARNFFIGNSNLITNMSIVYEEAQDCQVLSKKLTIASVSQSVVAV